MKFKPGIWIAGLGGFALLVLLIYLLSGCGDKTVEPTTPETMVEINMEEALAEGWVWPVERRGVIRTLDEEKGEVFKTYSGRARTTYMDAEGNRYNWKGQQVYTIESTTWNCFTQADFREAQESLSDGDDINLVYNDVDYYWIDYAFTESFDMYTTDSGRASCWQDVDSTGAQRLTLVTGTWEFDRIYLRSGGVLHQYEVYDNVANPDSAYGTFRDCQWSNTTYHTAMFFTNDNVGGGSGGIVRLRFVDCTASEVPYKFNDGSYPWGGIANFIGGTSTLVLDGLTIRDEQTGICDKVLDKENSFTLAVLDEWTGYDGGTYSLTKPTLDYAQHVSFSAPCKAAFKFQRNWNGYADDADMSPVYTIEYGPDGGLGNSVTATHIGSGWYQAVFNVGTYYPGCQYTAQGVMVICDSEGHETEFRSAKIGPISISCGLCSGGFGPGFPGDSTATK